MLSRIVKRPGDNFPTLFRNIWDSDDFQDIFYQADYGVSLVPAVNLVENDNSFELEMIATGLDKKDLKLGVDKNVLEISADKETKSEEHDKKKKYLHREFSHTSFSRTFTLPANADVDKIKAKLENGVLHISVPKKENAAEVKKKEINIE